MQKDKGHAFTLIELLIVIAIISLLLAILFPVFARARESARRATCMSNLKQIALSMTMYSQDYDGRLPYVSFLGNNFTNATPNNPAGWSDAMYPYLKNTQILHCPSERDYSHIGAAGGPFAGVSDPTQWGYTDYWMNTDANGARDSSFGYPAETVLMGDGGTLVGGIGYGYAPNNMTGCWWGSVVEAPNCSSLGMGPGPANINYGGSYRHLGGTNYAFADGHVKWEKGTTDTSGIVAVVQNDATTHALANGQPTFALN